eukprot:scaffold761_cov114-Skeletonema_marinoi.AAC.2
MAMAGDGGRAHDNRLNLTAGLSILWSPAAPPSIHHTTALELLKPHITLQYSPYHTVGCSLLFANCYQSPTTE